MRRTVKGSGSGVGLGLSRGEPTQLLPLTCGDLRCEGLLSSKPSGFRSPRHSNTSCFLCPPRVIRPAAGEFDLSARVHQGLGDGRSGRHVRAPHGGLAGSSRPDRLYGIHCLLFRRYLPSFVSRLARVRLSMTPPAWCASEARVQTPPTLVRASAALELPATPGIPSPLMAEHSGDQSHLGSVHEPLRFRLVAITFRDGGHVLGRSCPFSARKERSVHLAGRERSGHGKMSCHTRAPQTARRRRRRLPTTWITSNP